MNFSRFTSIALAMVSLSFAATAEAAIVTLTPLKDNTLYESSEGNLSNGQGGSIFVGKTGFNDGFNLRRGLIAFNIASVIPAGSTVSNVTLTMFLAQSSPDPNSVSVSLHVASKDWGEGASSGGGAPFFPASHRTGSTVTRCTPLVSTRTEISARPGTTLGGRTITLTW